MGWTSTVPAALAALVAAFQAASGLEGVNVYDGPAVTSSTALEVILVGSTGERMSPRTGAYPEPVTPGTDYQAAVAGLAVAPQRETYTIKSVLAVLNGATNLTAARQRAYDLLAACGAAVAADKTLGGTVALATMGAHQMTPEQTSRGALVTIMFDVDVEAFTGR